MNVIINVMNGKKKTRHVVAKAEAPLTVLITVFLWIFTKAVFYGVAASKTGPYLTFTNPEMTQRHLYPQITFKFEILTVTSIIYTTHFFD